MDGFDIVRPRRRRLTAYARAVRQARIFARLRDGWAHDDIARDERLSVRRVRQIVSEALERRPVSDDETHLHLQIERLGPALQAAGAALAKGDAKAIRPLLKVLDQLDRYHAIVRARASGGADDPVSLVGKIERTAAPPDDGAEPGGAASRRPKGARGARPPGDAAMGAGPLAAAHQADSGARNFFRLHPLQAFENE
jgi:hypothetical protein